MRKRCSICNVKTWISKKEWKAVYKHFSGQDTEFMCSPCAEHLQTEWQATRRTGQTCDVCGSEGIMTARIMEIRNNPIRLCKTHADELLNWAKSTNLAIILAENGRITADKLEL